MKTYCVSLAALAGAPEYASRVEFLVFFAQEPTHVPGTHGLSEICEQQW